MNVSYDIAETRFNTEIRRMIETCTFDPHIVPAGRKYIFSGGNNNDSRDFYAKNIGVHDQPIYLLARTNNITGTLNNENRRSYLKIVSEKKKPVFGIWEGVQSTYFDTVSVEGTTEATNDTEIRISQYQYDQDSVIKIDHYGNFITLRTQVDFKSAIGKWRKNK